MTIVDDGSRFSESIGRSWPTLRRAALASGWLELQLKYKDAQASTRMR
jgi:hypothetical protein